MKNFLSCLSLALRNNFIIFWISEIFISLIDFFDFLFFSKVNSGFRLNFFDIVKHTKSFFSVKSVVFYILILLLNFLLLDFQSYIFLNLFPDLIGVIFFEPSFSLLFVKSHFQVFLPVRISFYVFFDENRLKSRSIIFNYAVCPSQVNNHIFF